MIHAYDKSYLSAAQKNLARMLDYLVNDLHYPLETAWQWFVTSELSARFEQGDCSVLVGLSGVELARAVLEQAGEVVPMQKPSSSFSTIKAEIPPRVPLDLSVMAIITKTSA